MHSPHSDLFFGAEWLCLSHELIPFTSAKKEAVEAGVDGAFSGLSHLYTQISAESSLGTSLKVQFPLKEQAQTESLFQRCLSAWLFLDVVNICCPRLATISTSCSGHTHAEKAFVDGSCPYCENRTMAMLQSRLFSSQRRSNFSHSPILVLLECTRLRRQVLMAI